MRLWTVHPSCLDAKGLVAAWREGLLAQKVLAGETRGYTRHPQLQRFRAQARPRVAIAGYLRGLAAEAVRRGYRFDASKIAPLRQTVPIEETEGQLRYEWRHLLAKLRTRDPALWRRLEALPAPPAHPAFRIVPGDVQAWEKRPAETRTPAAAGARPGAGRPTGTDPPPARGSARSPRRRP